MHRHFISRYLYKNIITRGTGHISRLNINISIVIEEVSYHTHRYISTTGHLRRSCFQYKYSNIRKWENSSTKSSTVKYKMINMMLSVPSYS